MKILLTGGTGFLGSYIIRELIGSGHSVRAIRRGPKLPSFLPASVFENVEWREGDILDISSLEEAMEGVEVVVHSAGLVSYQPRDRKELYKTNIEGTSNMVNASLAQNIKRFIHISSVAALGSTNDGGPVADGPVAEGRQWEENKFSTHYGVSKYQGEMEVWRGMGEGLNVAIVNPSTILGYGDWNTGSCAIFKNVFREFPWFTEGANGFVDVSDVARAVTCLLDSAVEGERFILNGDNWTFHHLFNRIADGLGKRHPPRKVTPFLAAVAWRVEAMKAVLTGNIPVLTRETAEIALKVSAFDNNKFLTHFPGFRFTALEQTIDAACRQYLQNPK